MYQETKKWQCFFSYEDWFTISRYFVKIHSALKQPIPILYSIPFLETSIFPVVPENEGSWLEMLHSRCNSMFYVCLICTDMLCKTGNNKVSWRPITCLNVRGSYKIACVLCCFFILNTKWHQRTMRIQRRKQPKEGIPAQGQILTTTKRILNFMVKHLTSQYEFILTKYLQGQFILLSMCCSDIDICSNSDINGLFLSAVF